MLARLLLESPPSRVRERRDLLDALEAYLAELWWNGQIHRDHLISRAPLAAYVDLPRQGALSVQFHSAGGKKALARFEAQYGVTVSWNLLESRPLRRHRSWRSASSLYLFTHAFDTHAPLCVDGLDDAAPLYLLPITERARMDLQWWASDYRDHDRMWLSSGRLEMRAYRELADPTSVLCSRGRDLCRMIEKATRKPTYFYLQRYYAHHKGEQERPCPGCGGHWAVPRSNLADTRFSRIEFRCRRCRLVSPCGVSEEGERRARIGERR